MTGKINALNAINKQIASKRSGRITAWGSGGFSTTGTWSSYVVPTGKKAKVIVIMGVDEFGSNTQLAIQAVTSGGISSDIVRLLNTGTIRSGQGITVLEAGSFLNAAGNNAANDATGFIDMTIEELPA